ncbi:MAG TPA: asparagine--tRNA ligase [Thermoplasmata archaeon]|nr:asparagine--tRNA ligase [Thermoplasmata archaeon]
MAGISVIPDPGEFQPIESAFAPDAVGRRFKVRGWVLRGRSSGGILFVVLRDRSGIIQVTAKKDVLGAERFAAAEHTQVEGALQVEGVIADDRRAPGGRELRADRVDVVDAGEPFPIFADQTEEFRLDKRHLVVRSQDLVATFRVRAEVLRALRGFLEREEILEVTAPIITANAAEGGSEAFQFDYFGRPGYLSQTGQLYLEALLFPNERVYALSTSFRAEKSRTPRHLTEYTHLEVELAWTGLTELMELTERMIVSVLHEVAQRRPKELTQLGRPPEELLALSVPFPRITYREAVDRLAAKGLPVQYGSDLGTAEERALTLEEKLPIFVTHFPARLKAFYMLRSPTNPEEVEAADLLAPEGYGEIVGGSARETDNARLVERLKETGANLADYEWYLDLRRHGSVPHAGFGLGVERLLRWALRREHIRETIPFPRTPSRHTP